MSLPHSALQRCMYNCVFSVWYHIKQGAKLVFWPEAFFHVMHLIILNDHSSIFGVIGLIQSINVTHVSQNIIVRFSITVMLMLNWQMSQHCLLPLQVLPWWAGRTVGQMAFCQGRWCPFHRVWIEKLLSDWLLRSDTKCLSRRVWGLVAGRQHRSQLLALKTFSLPGCDRWPLTHSGSGRSIEKYYKNARVANL